MPPELLYANGIDGSSGSYLLPPQDAPALVEAALAQEVAPDHARELRDKWEQANLPSFAPLAGLDPLNLAEVGWGVVFAFGADPKIRDALQPLLQHRQEAAGPYYKEFVGTTAYRPGDSYLDFLGRSKMGPGPADPDYVPYYLLLVGDPETIPFEFQYQLDVQYGVGRLHFDTLEEYAAYARSVVAAETGPPPRPRRVAFVGTKNPDDAATQQSADLLIGPLLQRTAADFPDWSPRGVLAGEATKAGLGRLLGGPDTPGLLFTASHGMAFPEGDSRQFADQGALLGQDWPGPEQWGRQPIPPDLYFAAADVGNDARLHGLVTFHFACYGAGTPRLDDYPHPKLTARPSIAPRAFLARLPQRLLAHPDGGALAVVGHVERTWPCTFRWQNAASQLGIFRGMLRLLLRGQRVGWALDQFNLRYAELAAQLGQIARDVKYGFQPDPLDLAYLWTASNDARGLVVLGDPAVRLSVAPAGA
jgi:hypothetical protein